MTSDQTRIVSVVSPTCPDCRSGAGMISQALKRRPEAMVAALVVWALMRQGDSEEEALLAGRDFGDDHRVFQYWESPGWTFSAALRPPLGLGPYTSEASAWDVYLLYQPGTRWDERFPPPPTEWAYNTREPLAGAVGRISRTHPIDPVP